MPPGFPPPGMLPPGVPPFAPGMPPPGMPGAPPFLPGMGPPPFGQAPPGFSPPPGAMGPGGAPVPPPSSLSQGGMLQPPVSTTPSAESSVSKTQQLSASGVPSKPPIPNPALKQENPELKKGQVLKYTDANYSPVSLGSLSVYPSKLLMSSDVIT